jgi:hypothetical protein
MPPLPAQRPQRGPLILALGVAALVLCPVLGPVAWILGKVELDDIATGRRDPAGRSLAQAGLVCGIVGTVSLLLLLAWALGLIVFALVASARGPHLGLVGAWLA